MARRGLGGRRSGRSVKGEREEEADVQRAGYVLVGATQLDPTPRNHITSNYIEYIRCNNLPNTHKAELTHSNLHLSNLSNLISGGGVSLCGPCFRQKGFRLAGWQAGPGRAAWYPKAQNPTP